jgi:hypothetical protein
MSSSNNNHCRKLSRTDCLPPDCKFANGAKRQFCRKSKNKINKINKTKKISRRSKSPTSINKCRQLSRTDCLPPDCKFANGAKRQFCRKSTNKKKSIDENKNKQETAAKKITKFIKNITKKRSIIKNKNKRETAAKKITKFIKNITKKSKSDKNKQDVAAKKITQFIKNINKKKKIVATVDKAKTKIGQFMKSKRHHITSRFLNSVCPSSGVCIAFGKETTKIKEFFNNFVDKQYRDSTKKLQEGDNGIVYEYIYERLKYKAYTIVKMTKSSIADNLMYEYFVGLYINSVYKKFPCFLETYGLSTNPIVTYKDIEFNNYTIDSLNDLKILELLNISCKKPEDISIQIEHIHNPITLENMIHKLSFWKNEMVPVLFQIYYALSQLKDTFTHYDLHTSNLLLYEPIKDKYMMFHYHLANGQVVRFMSRYIAKIIDYGRSYFHDSENPNINSNYIYSKLCDPLASECNKSIMDCGSDKGFAWLYAGKGTKGNYYINSRIRNMSHDLRLLHILGKKYNGNSIMIRQQFSNVNMKELIGKFFTNITYTSDYGTREVTREVKGNTQSKIANVVDAYKVLKMICLTTDFTNMNQEYLVSDFPLDSKIGDLHIYHDRDMVFNPHK